MNYETNTHTIEQDARTTINISAFRLMLIYMVLSQCLRVSFKELNNQLLNHPMIQRMFTLETIDKYMNTLRMFGCVIQRREEANGILFELVDHPLKTPLLPEESRALEKLNLVLARYPVPRLAEQFQLLLHRLVKSTFQLAEPIAPAALQAFYTLPMEVQFQVTCFQKYCREAQFIEVHYAAPPDGVEPEETRFVVAPEALVFEQKRFFLRGTNPRTNRKVRLALDYIQSHRQLPNRISVQAIRTTVQFQLTGRLIQSYKPYPGEILETHPDHLQVTHTTDDLDVLLCRLLKYDTHCRILSPTLAQQAMRRKIDHLLEHCTQPI